VAVQLGAVRLLGTFLDDPADAPAPAVRYAADQLAIPGHAEAIAAYAASAGRWRHGNRIRERYRYRQLADAGVAFRLNRFRRRLPRRGAPGRQARAGRGRQDAGRGRGRDHGREEAEAAAAHGGQGLAQGGGREEIAKRDFAPGSTVVSDGLSCWPAVEEAGCEHFPIVTGSGKRAASWTPFRWVDTTLGNLKTAIAGTYHHVGAKHAQRSYLTSFAHRFNRRFRLDSILERLAWAAMRTAPQPYRVITADA